MAMNIYDMVSRADAIVKQYDKYVKETKREKKVDKKGGDSFASEFEDVEIKVAEIEQLAEEITQSRERTVIAAKNAEVRRRKNAVIAEDIEQLKKLAPKGKVSKDVVAGRFKQIDALEDRIFAISDGMNAVRKKPGAAPKRSGLLGSKKQHIEIEIGDMSEINDNPAYYDVTEENKQFDAEWKQSKMKQDGQLDIIQKGVGNLRNIAEDMNSELKNQDMLVTEIEENMDKATKGIQTNNQKLAGVLKKVRSQRNFCMDIILLTILLAVGAYIYTLVK